MIKLKIDRQSLIGIAILLSALILITIANYYLLASDAGGMTRKDFMSLWTGGKTLVLGVNPYDPEVWRPLRASYGDTWLPDPTAPFPAWTFLFFIPLSFFPVQMAGAIWMTISEIALLIGVLVLAQGLRWPNFKRDLPWLLLGVALFRPLFSAIANGQLAPVLFFLLVVSFYLHRRGYPFWSGVILALQIMKPNITVFFLPMVGLIFLLRRDWSVLGGMVASGITLLGISWLFLPGWPLQWLQAADKATVAFATPTVWGLAHELSPQYWLTLSVIFVIVVQLITLLIIWQERHNDWLFSFAFALSSSILATPYLWAYDQLPLYFPAFVALYWGIKASGQPRLWLVLWLGIMVGLSWGGVIIAQIRGVDTLTAFVTIAIMAFLSYAYTRLRRQNDVPSSMH